MRTPAKELLEQCVAAHAAGMDFPSIWEALLADHPLVVGIPVSVPGPKLGVALTTGGQLLYGERGFEVAGGEEMPESGEC